MDIQLGICSHAADWASCCHIYNKIQSSKNTDCISIHSAKIFRHVIKEQSKHVNEQSKHKKMVEVNRLKHTHCSSLSGGCVHRQNYNRSQFFRSLQLICRLNSIKMKWYGCNNSFEHICGSGDQSNNLMINTVCLINICTKRNRVIGQNESMHLIWLSKILQLIQENKVDLAL